MLFPGALMLVLREAWGDALERSLYIKNFGFLLNETRFFFRVQPLPAGRLAPLRTSPGPYRTFLEAYVVLEEFVKELSDALQSRSDDGTDFHRSLRTRRYGKAFSNLQRYQNDETYE